MSSPVESLVVADTILCADSAESCPGEPGLFAVGTYQLDEATQSRHGSVVLYRYSPAGLGVVARAPPTQGILDMKW